MNRSLGTWVDGTVRATDGDVGKIAQFYFDDLTWSVRYMAVTTGDPPAGRTVLISLAALGKPDWKHQVFPVTLTKAQVLSSPTTDADKPVSRQHEVELQEYYAWPMYWGGGFYVPPIAAVAAPAAREAAPTETPSSGVRSLDPHLHSTRELTDCRVHATDGNIGHVEDSLFDDASWVIRYLVVNTRTWLSDRRVIVSPQWIRAVNWTEDEIFVDLSRHAVEKSPRFDPSKTVSSDDEGKLRDHLQKPTLTEWVMFKFHAPRGTNVTVAGTFNNWNTTSIKLGHSSKGTYTAMVLLPFGRYEYKFIVNGDWRNGPDCHEQVPNPFGTTNSVLMVGHSVDHNAHLHTFVRRPLHQSDPTLTKPIGV